MPLGHLTNRLKPISLFIVGLFVCIPSITLSMINPTENIIDIWKNNLRPLTEVQAEQASAEVQNDILAAIEEGRINHAVAHLGFYESYPNLWSEVEPNLSINRAIDARLMRQYLFLSFLAESPLEDLSEDDLDALEPRFPEHVNLQRKLRENLHQETSTYRAQQLGAILGGDSEILHQMPTGDQIDLLNTILLGSDREGMINVVEKSVILRRIALSHSKANPLDQRMWIYIYKTLQSAWGIAQNYTESDHREWLDAALALPEELQAVGGYRGLILNIDLLRETDWETNDDQTIAPTIHGAWANAYDYQKSWAEVYRWIHEDSDRGERLLAGLILASASQPSGMSAFSGEASFTNSIQRLQDVSSHLFYGELGMSSQSLGCENNRLVSCPYLSMLYAPVLANLVQVGISQSSSLDLMDSLANILVDRPAFDMVREATLQGQPLVHHLATITAAQDDDGSLELEATLLANTKGLSNKLICNYLKPKPGSPGDFYFKSDNLGTSVPVIVPYAQAFPRYYFAEGTEAQRDEAKEIVEQVGDQMLLLARLASPEQDYRSFIDTFLTPVQDFFDLECEYPTSAVFLFETLQPAYGAIQTYYDQKLGTAHQEQMDLSQMEPVLGGMTL